MFAKICFITLGFCLANAFYIERQESHPYYLVEEANILEDSLEDGLSERVMYRPKTHPYYLVEEANILEDSLEDDFSERPSRVRVARQAGSVSSNPDGSLNVQAKVPLFGNDRNVLSAVASGQGLQGGNYAAAGGGLAIDNVNGHGLSLTGAHVPALGDQLTAAARANLLHTDHHNLNANAFVTRTLPKNPLIPDFTTRGASLDYMFNNKAGASVGMSQTPLFQRTDYSAMGTLNLHRTPSSSLDFNAGVSKTVSPYVPSSRWQPSAGLSFTRFW